MSKPPTISILDIPIHAITLPATLAWIEQAIAERQPRQICTANPEFVIAAQRDAEFRAILRHAGLVLPDGVGLLWAARWQGQTLPERVPGSDLIERIPEYGATRGWRLFFLGAAEGVAQRAAAILQTRYPGWVLAGAMPGDPAPAADPALIPLIRQTRPDVLFVAYGAPKQDQWIARNLPHLNVPVCIGVGGSFDFVAGVIPRAPQWAQHLGLEWAFRLWRQPQRLGRIFRAVVQFPLAVLRHRL
jgi:N-acetylglucosaminyldiphosphoundecaprenol N-acetyl-beta-D-mannosaminyltransferase